MTDATKINYDSLVRQLDGLLVGRWLTDLANTSAFLFSELPDLNWVGIYLLENQTLWLGPFQGKPACTEIPLGRGVCGRAAAEKHSILVADVHAFTDHIVCDAASRSEIVIPLIGSRDGSKAEEVIGVLDVDSPSLGRFTERDQAGLEAVVARLIARNESRL